MAMTLPYGPRGQALAAGMAVAVLAVAWAGVLGPAIGWYQDRAEALQRQAALLQRMTLVTGQLPALRHQAAAHAGGGATGSLLQGGTDALAAAALQQRIDALAKAAGIGIGSEEILPAQADGDLRAISVRVTITAGFRPLTAFLLALAQSHTPMIVDDMQLREPAPSLQSPILPVDASLSIIAYRAAR
jgi:general secretion pathway protein M